MSLLVNQVRAAGEATRGLRPDRQGRPAVPERDGLRRRLRAVPTSRCRWRCAGATPFVLASPGLPGQPVRRRNWRCGSQQGVAAGRDGRRVLRPDEPVVQEADVRERRDGKCRANADRLRLRHRAFAIRIGLRMPRRMAAAMALLVFAVCLVAGWPRRTRSPRSLGHALVAMAATLVVGLVVGVMAAEDARRERERAEGQGNEHRTPTAGTGRGKNRRKYRRSKTGERVRPINDRRLAP